MSKNVYILSRYKFFQMIVENKITEDNIESLEGLGIYIISINDPVGWNEQADFTDKQLSNVLTLNFADLRVDLTSDELCKTKPIKLIDDVDIDMIHNFINKIKLVDNFTLYIHCHAGISRSAAVGLFAYEELLNKTYDDFIKDNPKTAYNKIIYQKLIKK